MSLRKTVRISFALDIDQTSMLTRVLDPLYLEACAAAENSRVVNTHDCPHRRDRDTLRDVLSALRGAFR